MQESLQALALAQQRHQKQDMIKVIGSAANESYKESAQMMK
jgi:hypothetical protein